MLEPISNALNLLLQPCYDLSGNWWVAILLFTLATKVILMPVSLWSQRSGLTMLQLMPDLNRIKAKHFGDKETIGEMQAAMYKQKGYHPLVSLIPLIIQILILFGLVDVVHTIAESGVAGTEALGVTPLVDGGATWLWPVAAVCSALCLCYAQNRINPLQREQSKREQNMTNGLSVGLALVLGILVPAGLAFYWVCSNLSSILVQVACNLIMRPEKYVDYEDLAESRVELDALNAVGQENATKSAWWKRDPEAKREKADYKRFFSIADKHLVFYSEGSGFYKYFEGAIQYILTHSSGVIHYVTNDPNDQVFELSKSMPRLVPYYIGPKKAITLMMKMDADVVVMTLHDLETYYIKRSYVKKDIEYIFMFHHMTSTHLVSAKSSLFHYDTILLAGPHQKAEVLRAEELYDLPKKRLVEAGYDLIDREIAAYAEMSGEDVGAMTPRPDVPSPVVHEPVAEPVPEEPASEEPVVADEGEALEVDTRNSWWLEDDGFDDELLKEAMGDSEGDDAETASEEVAEPEPAEAEGSDGTEEAAGADEADVAGESSEAEGVDEAEEADEAEGDDEDAADEKASAGKHAMKSEQEEAANAKAASGKHVAADKAEDEKAEGSDESGGSDEPGESGEADEPEGLEKADEPEAPEEAEGPEAPKVEVEDVPEDAPVVLIAPSWQVDSILDTCIDELITGLVGHGWRIIVRPHPEYTKRYRARWEGLQARWAHAPESALYFERDFSSNRTVWTAAVVITDWSSIAGEFSFSTLKPSIFIDTPMKVHNPDWEELGIEPTDIALRNQIGVAVPMDEADGIGAVVQQMLDEGESWRERILEVREGFLYNIGHAAEVSGEYILQAVLRAQQAHEQADEQDGGSEEEPESDAAAEDAPDASEKEA